MREINLADTARGDSATMTTDDTPPTDLPDRATRVRVRAVRDLGLARISVEAARA